MHEDCVDATVAACWLARYRSKASTAETSTESAKRAARIPAVALLTPAQLPLLAAAIAAAASPEHTTAKRFKQISVVAEPLAEYAPAAVASQEVHAGLPVSEAKRPAAHYSAHALYPTAAAMVPAGQRSQCVEQPETTANVHDVHADTPVEEEAEPGAHSAPASLEHVPGGHACG